MGKVHFLDPIDYISGKIAKAFRTIYNHRKVSLLNFTSVRIRPRSTQPDQEELARRLKFKQIRQAVVTRAKNLATLTQDQLAFGAARKAGSKYTTFHGWLTGKGYEFWNDSTHTVDWPNSWDE